MRIFPLICLTVTLLCRTAVADSTANFTAELTEFESCRIGSATTTVPAECATITVPFTHGLAPATLQTEDTRVAPETLSLSIAKVASRGNQAAEDPITILAGGPGQSAIDSWPQLRNAFYPMLANRDVYLIDQRGTGNSARMDCPSPPPGTELTLDLEDISRSAIECYEKQLLPTEWFTTSVAVRDLDLVRKTLGIERWNIYGVSYGTRVALHYLRKYPQHTRSVILDAVVAPTKPIGPDLPLHSQDALDALLERCSKDSGCSEAFPDLANKTRILFESLKQTPRTVQFENVSRGALDSMQFNDQHLATTVRLLTYSSYGTAILPSMLHDAATNNNLAPFARQAAMQLNQLDGSMATGMHAAVICTEDVPYIDSAIDRDALEATYLGGSVVDAMQTSCDHWPTGVIDEDFHEPLVSDVPVLALSGSVDPITPPAYAELAIESLSNARHIVNAHQGHMQAPLGCVPSVMSHFIETATPDELNIECLERLLPPAMFIDANGPSP